MYVTTSRRRPHPSADVTQFWVRERRVGHVFPIRWGEAAYGERLVLFQGHENVVVLPSPRFGQTQGHRVDLIAVGNELRERSLLFALFGGTAGRRCWSLAAFRGAASKRFRLQNLLCRYADVVIIVFVGRGFDQLKVGAVVGQRFLIFFLLHIHVAPILINA